jgi:hypothetical protein
MKKSTADYWAPRINAEWRKTVQGIVNVGRELIAAKAACPHGEYSRLFKGSDNPVPEPVPFTIHTADRLMRIAARPAIADCAHAHSLPQSWATLHELARLDDDEIVAGISAGEINRKMTRADAVALRGTPRVKAAPADDLCVIVNEAFGAVYDKYSSRLDVISRRVVIEHLERLLAKLRHEQTEESSGEEAGPPAPDCHYAEAM